MQITNVFSIFNANKLSLPNVSTHEEHDMDTFYERHDLVFVEDERTIVYEASEIEGPAEEFLLINDSTIEKAYLFTAFAYRGDGCYNGFVKVDGKWWDCDFVGEGMATQLEITDEEMAKLVAENDQHGDDEEE